MRLALSVCTATLLGCASLPPPTRACIMASIAAARADIEAVRSCVHTPVAVDECIEQSAQATLSDADAVMACIP